MAWAFVKQNATIGIGVLTQPTAFGSNVASGSLIIVPIHLSSELTNVNTVTDTLSTSYSAVAIPTVLSSFGLAVIYYGITTSAGADTVTVTTDVGDNIYVGVAEYTGIQASPLDKFVGASGSSTTPASGNTAATTADNDLAFAFAFVTNTAAAGSGWNSRSTFNGDCFEDKNITPTGVVNGAFTQSPTGPWIAVVATFKQSGGAAFTPRAEEITLQAVSRASVR